MSPGRQSAFPDSFIKRALGFINHDDRLDARSTPVFWLADPGQASQFLYGYGSTWFPAAELQPASRAALADAPFAPSRHGGVSLHLNKGLAGAPADAAAARDTATNPVVLETQ